MSPSKPAKKAGKKAGKKVGKKVRDTVDKAAERASEMLDPTIPGRPGSAPAPLDEPTTPVEPLPPKPDQGSPVDTATQQGAYLTTSQGARLRDSDHSLKAGPRGPTLLQGQGQGDPGLRPVLHGAGIARLRRHGARHPRLRD